jgi:uncharacterized membrane protein (UPF0136 family)
MNRLILDYFRRWWWALALVAVLEFGLGWFIVGLPEQNFEFWGLMLAMGVGANLVSFDLRRGVLRAVAVLPLTGRQIGRAWWLATVPIPAIALAALLFLGAAIFCHFHPERPFLANRLALAGLFNVAWLSTVFTCVFPSTGVFGKGRERAGGCVFSLLSMIMLYGGMFYFQNAHDTPFKCALLLGVGALLTAVGWFRAERFSPGRAGIQAMVPQGKGQRGQQGVVEDHLRRYEALRPPATASRLRRWMFDRSMRRMEAMAAGSPRGEHHPPSGYGGMPFLIRTTFFRGFLYIAVMVALLALLTRWQRQMMPLGTAGDMDIMFNATMGSFMSSWFIVFYSLMPVLPHLRFLRTLPVSATGLAGVMIGIAVLPLLALGALVAGVAALSAGTPFAVTVLKSYTFMLAPGALCVFFAVWRGIGVPAGALVLATLFGFFLAPLWLKGYFHQTEIPFLQAGLFVAACILLALLLTRRALQRGSRAYRIQASPMSQHPWLPGR